MAVLAFDLFCRVIDNFGDAGVCWRLARQLARMGHAVRLWIDAPGVLTRLLPALNPEAGPWHIEGVAIGDWSQAAQARPPHDGIVIEAFACALPPAYEAALAAHHCLWINLEYLSAEHWVEGCHGLPSPQSSGVPKYFYFPGFTPATGGLLREPDLMARRAAALRQDRRQRLHSLTGLATDELTDDALCILLFCYPEAPLAGLQAGLEGRDAPTWLLVPGEPRHGLQDRGALRVRSIPFVPQARFDDLLWCCDLNFVRGEDSLVRAHWAGTPLVWQLYRQEQDTHLDKLEAWLTRARWPAPAEALTRAWNRLDAGSVARLLPEALQADHWTAWQTRSQAWSRQLAAQIDLAQGLQDFCLKRRQKS